MIKEVTVKNFKGEEITLELTHPEKSGLIVKDITGIGGGDANVNTTELAGGDGSLFNSAKMDTRNIVFTLMPLLFPSVEENRHLIYRYFPLKKEVELKFVTTVRTSTIKGYVEKIDTGIFSKEEETQVSIVCPDPYFYGVDVQDAAFEGVHPLFQFPFSNPLGEKTLIFSEIRTDTRATLEYYGDADAGVTIKILFFGPVTGIKIYAIDTNEKIVINTNRLSSLVGGAVKQGDEMEISTIRQQRTVTYLRDSKHYNVLGAIDRDSDWFQLTAGKNSFEFTTDSGRDNMRMIISYVDNYGGV